MNTKDVKRYAELRDKEKLTDEELDWLDSIEAELTKYDLATAYLSQREALEKIRGDYEDGFGSVNQGPNGPYSYCSHCMQSEIDGHDEDCPAGIAIKALGE